MIGGGGATESVGAGGCTGATEFWNEPLGAASFPVPVPTYPAVGSGMPALFSVSLSSCLVVVGVGLGGQFGCRTGWVTGVEMGWHLGRLDSRVFFNCSRTAWSSLRVAILSMSLCCFSFSLARIAATSASDLGGVSASVDTSGRVSEAPRRPGAIGRTHLLDPLFRRCIERSVARFVAPTPRAPPMAACGHSAAHIADDIA